MDRESTWRFLQLCMAGGLAITAVNIHNLIQDKAAANSYAASDFKLLNPQLATPFQIQERVSVPAPKYTEPREIESPIQNDSETFAERTDSMKSIAEFGILEMSDVSRDWISRLIQDEQADPNPLFDKSAIYSVALILDRGIKRFTRESFKGPEEMSLGFDMVRYEVVQNDDTLSYVLAFRRKSTESTPTEDRPVLSMFLVSRDQDQMYLSLYQEGQPPENRMIQRQDAEENYVPTKVANAGWMRH